MEERIEAWGVEMTAVHCARCGEAHLTPVGEAPPRCPFCFQGPVVPQPAYLPEEPPEQIVPYGVPEARLAAILEKWSAGLWFRPDELNGRTLAQRARRYLIPLWLVDGRVEGVWRADVGFDYEAVSYQDRYRDGAGWRSEEVRERRVRWEPRAGRIARAYENVAAPALEDHRALMARLGDFDLSRREPYTPDAAAHAAVRVPTLEPQAAWPGAEAAFVQAAADDCRRAAGADHVRDFQIQAEYGGLNWTLLLLPAYAAWYEEGGKAWPLLINGQTGQVSGARRASARKANTTSWAFGGAALLLFALGALLALAGALLPPLLAVGGLILILGLLLGVAAPIPAIAVWAYNRRAAPG